MELWIVLACLIGIQVWLVEALRKHKSAPNNPAPNASSKQYDERFEAAIRYNMDKAMERAMHYSLGWDKVLDSMTQEQKEGAVSTLGYLYSYWMRDDVGIADLSALAVNMFSIHVDRLHNDDEKKD